MATLDAGRRARLIRRNVMSAIASIESLISAQVNVENISTVKCTVDQMNSEFSEFHSLCLDFESDNVDAAAATAHNNAVDDDLNLVMSKVLNATGRARAFLAEYESDQSNNSILNQTFGNNSMQSHSEVANIKLPRIEVPKFDGEIENFLEFSELFKNLIHDEQTVSKVRKLYYLKDSLKDGKAAELIADIPLNDRGYDEAWTLLTSTYKDMKSIVRRHLDKLFEIPRIKSSQDIPAFLSKVNRFRKGIKACGEEPDSFYLSYIVSERLDKHSFDEFERSLATNAVFPSWDDIRKFLERRAFVSKRISDKVILPPYRNPKEKNKGVSFVATSALGSGSNQNNFGVLPSVKLFCPLCKQEHTIVKCPKFIKAAPTVRYQLIKEAHLCVNCLGSHKVKACKSRTTCSTCKLQHHSMLHFEKKPDPALNDEDPSKDTSLGSKAVAHVSVNRSSSFGRDSASVVRENNAILPTAVIKFECGSKSGEFRALFDSGSQINLVSRSFVDRYQLRTIRLGTIVSGIDSAIINSVNSVNLSILLPSRQSSFDVTFSIVEKLPYSSSFSIGQLCRDLRKFPLADLAFYESEIDIPFVDALFGIETYNYLVGNLTYNLASLCVRESKVGWIISSTRSVDSSSLSSSSSIQSCYHATVDKVEALLRRFWELETIPHRYTRSEEDEAFLTHFRQTTVRGPDGKFIVELPFKLDPKIVTGNYKRALAHSRNLERRLKDENLAQYSAFMNDYEEKGHLSLISDSEDDSDRYYINHHAVYRASSTTTPLRVVFNASAKSVNNVSLNDILLVGPMLQPLLADNLLLFRTRRYALTGDIAQMYRNAWIKEEHRKYLSIIWQGRRQLNTITYGTGPAASQATLLLDLIAEECKNTHPLAYDVIKAQFYMDDVISGADTISDLVELRRQVHEALLGYGFKLRKYNSNSLEVLSSIDSDLVALNPEVDFGEEEALSVLGLKWRSNVDTLSLKADFELPEKVSTKRQMYSTIMRVFDPLGLASPVTIRGKILLQKLWKIGIAWDAPVPVDVFAEFKSYLLDLQSLPRFELPRYIFNFNFRSEHVVGFCDASEQAYAAAVYLVNEGCTPRRVQLLTSKTRVAPLSSRTVPELELQAAVLLVDLVEYVVNVLKIEKARVHLYTDSTIVLAWLSRPASDWKIFVRNRVAKITATFPIDQWSHVRSKENPADLATRGLDTESLIRSSLWKSGPEFIVADRSENVNIAPEFDQNQCLPYLSKPKAAVFVATSYAAGYTKLIESFSSYEKLVRIFATGQLIAETWRPNTSIVLPKLDSDRLLKAHNSLVRDVQEVVFAQDFERLRANRKLRKRSALRSHNPFIDEMGILRSLSRIQNARKPFNERCPIILPANHHFTTIFVRHLHVLYFHANRAWILAHLSSNYLFIGGIARVIKSITYQCVTCCRYLAKSKPQMMANLPSDRVVPNSPFSVVGIDYTGAFHIKCENHRTQKELKAYAAIFVCFATRAVHIEVVPSLSTEDFLGALKIFVSRRGCPNRIYSDNGTNFKGADRYLNFGSEEISQFATQNRITWLFNPPYCPHRGGLWESAVKSAKRVLAITTKDQKLSFFELSTYLSQIECILNSRPLVYRKSNAPEEEVLTPGHFLIGRNLTVVPEPDRTPNLKLSDHFKANKARVQSFWRIWSQDYLAQLRSRSKWQEPTSNFEIGQIVLVPDSGTNPCRWPIATVSKVFPDSQQLVRTVEIRSGSSSRVVPVTQIIRIPIE